MILTNEDFAAAARRGYEEECRRLGDEPRWDDESEDTKAHWLAVSRAIMVPADVPVVDVLEGGATSSRRHVFVVPEKHGNIELTQRQLDWIKKAAGGDGVAGGNSAAANLSVRIQQATGWKKMRFIQLCCFFAMKHGLVELREPEPEVGA